MLNFHDCMTAGIKSTFVNIVHNQGVRGLYKGLLPTLAAIGPFIGTQQSTYDLLKHWFTDKGFQASPGLFLTCGSIAGITAQTVCMYMCVYMIFFSHELVLLICRLYILLMWSEDECRSTQQTRVLWRRQECYLCSRNYLPVFQQLT